MQIPNRAHGFRATKPQRFTKHGVPYKGDVLDPLTKICRQALEELRNEQLSFVVVGCPVRCNKGCWRQRECQLADKRAFEALGDVVQPAQFPLASLRATDEITESFRGFLLRCDCLTSEEHLSGSDGDGGRSSAMKEQAPGPTNAAVAANSKNPTTAKRQRSTTKDNTPSNPQEPTS